MKCFATTVHGFFTTKHCCKVLHLRCCVGPAASGGFLFKACKFIKKSQYRCFPVIFAKFLRTAVGKNICEQLLVTIRNNLVLANLFSSLSTLHFFYFFLYLFFLVKVQENFIIFLRNMKFELRHSGDCL